MVSGWWLVDKDAGGAVTGSNLEKDSSKCRWVWGMGTGLTPLWGMGKCSKASYCMRFPLFIFSFVDFLNPADSVFVPGG